MSFLQGLFGPPNVDELKARRDAGGLVRALAYKKDHAVRRAAAEALGQIADARAVEPLCAALLTDALQHDDSPGVRRRARRALDQLAAPSP